MSDYNVWSILNQMYVLLVLLLSKNCKIIFIPEICTFGQNTFINCSRITVIHIHVNVFLKFTLHVTVAHTESNLCSSNAPSESKKRTLSTLEFSIIMNIQVAFQCIFLGKSSATNAKLKCRCGGHFHKGPI